MIKIEIVHNINILKLIQEQCERKDIRGYTSMIVHSACGPDWGEYVGDFSNTQYYTFIIVDKSKAEELVTRLRRKIGGAEAFIFTSEVTLVTPPKD